MVHTLNPRKQTCGFTGFALKRIAVCSMVIDHIGSIVMDGVIAPYRVDDTIILTADMPFFVRNAFFIKTICAALGSVAFPLFCFLVAEGFIHTRNRLRYAGLLALFAILSEVPYDIAHYQTVLDFSLQNVLFTLCVGVLTLYGISRAEQKNPAARILLTVLCIVVSGGVSYLLRSEYVFLGIAAISLFYLLRGTRWKIAGIAPLLVASPWVLLAVPALLLYNGARGRGSKYFFYVFYPAHFLLLAGWAYLLANR